jgi:hypothetical protein
MGTSRRSGNRRATAASEPYRRRHFTYSFRAWIDDRGSNADRAHARYCHLVPRRCRHRKLWDLNTMGKSRNILRIIRGRNPLHFHVIVGPRYRTVFRIGRAVGWGP